MKKALAIILAVTFLLFGSTALTVKVSANNGSDGLPGNVLPQ